MYGAILGDMIGSPYEFDGGDKTKRFPLFVGKSRFTDDTVMTLAVAEAFMHCPGNRNILIDTMRKYGRRYPRAGYGGGFRRWLRSEDPKPYGSYGNGSAMRVSSVAWLFDDLETVRQMARLSAEVTHNHPEGIKGAEATAAAIFLARTGSKKKQIRDYIETQFGYDLHRTCRQIRPAYYHKESCQETVPEALIAFLEGRSFVDVIRTAVSLGGDCDTLTCIAGAVAEGYYGVPRRLKKACRARLPQDLLAVLDQFSAAIR